MTIDWLYKKKITVIFSNPCVYSSMQLYSFPILLCASTHANKQWSLCEIQGDNNSIILLTSFWHTETCISDRQHYAFCPAFKNSDLLLKRVVEVKVSLTLSQFQKVTFDDLTEFGFKTIKAI